MKILGLKDKNISIFSNEEILNKGKEIYKLKKNLSSDFENQDIKDNFARLKTSPSPYNLFRLNEMMDFSLNSVGVEITEEQYFERLEQLPPVPFSYDIYSGYIVPECITKDIYEHIFEHDKKFYCVIMSAQNLKLLRSWF